MPHIKTSDGVSLYYEETGSGAPLIFLHEFGGHYLSWEPQVRYFSRRYRCITTPRAAGRRRTCRRMWRCIPRRAPPTTAPT